MNLTSDIVFLVEGEALIELVNYALQDTCRVIHNRVYPHADFRYYDTSKISGSWRNPDLQLSFLKFFMHYEGYIDESWVRIVFSEISNNNNDYYLSNGNKILHQLGITNVIQPKPVAYYTVRGLHIFLIALWARKAILLPVFFSLPQTIIYPNKGYSNSYRTDSAYDLYPAILKLIRRPFQQHSDDKETPNLYNYIPTTSLFNYRSLAWRPVIASSWSSVNDITLEDLDLIFSWLSTLKKNREKHYPLSPSAWIAPIFNLDPTRLAFTVDDVRLLNRRLLPADIVYAEDWHQDSYGKQRDSWRTWTGNYIQMGLDTGRVKKTSATEASLADLSTYFLTTLPRHGLLPPMVEEVRREHIDGCNKATPFRVFAKNKLVVSHSSSFFDYVSETLKTEGIDFHNPITKYDKPVESKPTVTDKKTFSFNDFREFYSLSYALLGFIEHLLYTTLEGNAPPEWQDVLNRHSNKNAIIDTEVFGYTPLINYIDIQGDRHVIPMRYIPYKLLSLEHLPIRTGSGQKYYLLPTPDCIASIIIALETSIRFIHIRWLDRFLLSHDTPELSDDYLAALRKEKGYYFNLFVNTDKSGAPWLRPTSTRLLKVFSAVSRYKKHIARTHFSKQMKYTHHDLTHYPLITALFCHNKEKTVLRENTYRAYYKHQIYFFHQIRYISNQPLLEPLPPLIQNLTSLADFQAAYDLRASFSTNYTPHGIRATVISLSSTFLSDEHIGQYISGHKKTSVARYVVINKQLVSDVSLLTDSKVISALSWSKANVFPAPKTTDQLLHSTFAIQAPNGEMLTNAEILARRHLLSTFSTHFCLANGDCPDDVVKTIGRASCGQCYLGLKSKGHLPAILAYTRRLSADMDELQSRLKRIDKTVADGALKVMELRFVHLVNEFSAWTLTAQHMLKNADKLRDNFLTIPDNGAGILLANLPQDNVITNLITRMSDAVSYPELSNSSLKADVFRLSAKLMKLDTSFSSLFSIDEDQQIYHEMKGRLESLMIANNFSIGQLEGLILEKPSPLPPRIAAL